MIVHITRMAKHQPIVNQGDPRPDIAVSSRAEPRRNLFLAASLRRAGVVHPVRIRDLSTAGARIESSLSAGIGNSVTLVRGTLVAEARVTWSTAAACGLRFLKPILVADWMVSPEVMAKQRVVAPAPMVKLGHALKPNRVKAAPGSVEQAADGLAEVVSLLERVEANLAGDPAMSEKHRADLRNLDLAMRRLAECGANLKACSARRG